MEKINVLGVDFHNVNMAEAVNQCKEFINSDKSHLIVTPNPEMVMIAKKNSEFKDILNHASLTIPDGIGIIKGANLLGTPLKERVAGYDLICQLLDLYQDGSHTFYFWGGKPRIAEMAKQKMEEKYPNIKILGTDDGYFDENKKQEVIERIRAAKPDILLVGLGMVKQEKMIQELLKDNLFKIGIGCGGSLDVLSGTVKRAPKLFIKLHIEWSWRLIKQPSRIGRMMVLPKFLKEVKQVAKQKAKNNP